MRCPSLLALAPALALALALPSVAVAQPSAADRDTARALVVEGRKQHDAKDFKGSLDSFKRAHAIMGVPTTGVGVAKALAGLGRLIEARDVALEVVRMPAAANAPEAFLQAQSEANALAESLAARIPEVKIQVEAAPGARVTVTDNGAEVSPATIGAPRKVDPGKHRVVASSPGLVDATTTVDIAEREKRDVRLVLRAAAVAAAPVVVPPPPAPPSARPEPAPAPAAPPTPSQGSTQRTIGFVVGGIGVGGVALGAVMGGLVLAKKSTVTANCTDHVCNAEGKAAADAAPPLAMISTVGFAAGGALLATGLGVVLTAPSKPKDAGASTPRLMADVGHLPSGATGLGLRGSW